MSCHVMSCIMSWSCPDNVMSRHVMSCHVMSCHVTSWHVMLCRVMSFHVLHEHGHTWTLNMLCGFILMFPPSPQPRRNLTSSAQDISVYRERNVAAKVSKVVYFLRSTMCAVLYVGIAHVCFSHAGFCGLVYSSNYMSVDIVFASLEERFVKWFYVKNRSRSALCVSIDKVQSCAKKKFSR